MDRQRQMELTCRDCGATDVCGVPEMHQRLQAIGVLRRGKDPEADVVVELLQNSAERLACRHCDHVGLILSDADDWDDWPSTATCTSCGASIPPERLEVFPDAKLCAGCQQKDETGTVDSSDIEYCPRCGDVMTMKTSRTGGVTRYVMTCTGCRR